MFLRRICMAFVAVGLSFTAVPVKLLLSVKAGAIPSETLVVIVKLPLKFNVGVNVKPANNVFTLEIAPEALQIPVVELNVEVTTPEVAVVKLPAAEFDSVNVAVTLALSTSEMTISVKFSGVSSV